MALDMLCQEMNGPWWLVRRCQKAICHSRAVKKNGEGCGERLKEKERERRALLSFVELASFLRKFCCQFEHCGFGMRAFVHFVVPLCRVYSF